MQDDLPREHQDAEDNCSTIPIWDPSETGSTTSEDEQFFAQDSEEKPAFSEEDAAPGLTASLGLVCHCPDFVSLSLDHSLTDETGPIASRSRIPVLCIPEARGGTFTFNNRSTHVTDDWHRRRPQPGKVHALYGDRYIGMHKCTTCVGVYFQIGHDRCFCAHINASVNWTSTTMCAVSAEELECVKQAIVKRLGEYAASQGWGAKDVLSDTVILVGLSIAHTPSGGVDGIGKGVVNGIVEFLNLSPEDVEIDPDAHGFAIQVGTKRRAVAKYDWTLPKDGYVDPAGYALVDHCGTPDLEWSWSNECGWDPAREGWAV